MKKSEVNIMAERIVIKARVINQAIAFEDKDVRLAQGELKAMCAMLKALSIDYEWEVDCSATQYTKFRIPEYGIDIIV